MTETATQLATITREEILRRARSCVGRGRYKLGRGGFDPNAAFPWYTPDEWCDCSGFAAWCIAEDRENHAIDGGWIETTAIITDATAHGMLFELVMGASIPGDVIVYGDSQTRTGAHQSWLTQGHVGIISAVDTAGRPYRVIHCSNGNQKALDHAIAETEPNVFFRNHAMVVRPKKIVEVA